MVWARAAVVGCVLSTALVGWWVVSALIPDRCAAEAEGDELARWAEVNLATEIERLAAPDDDVSDLVFRSSAGRGSSRFPVHTCEIASVRELSALDSEAPDLSLVVVGRFESAKVAASGLDEVYVIPDLAPDIVRGESYAVAVDGLSPNQPRVSVDLVEECVIVSGVLYGYTIDETVAIAQEVAAVAAAAVCEG